MTAYLQYRHDPRCVEIYRALTEGNDTLTYQNIKTSGFFKGCCEGTGKFNFWHQG